MIISYPISHPNIYQFRVGFVACKQSWEMPIGITQSDSARDASLTWNSFFKQGTSKVNGQRVKRFRNLLKRLYNSRSRSREMISELYTLCQQIPRSLLKWYYTSQFNWGLGYVNNQTQGWGTLENIWFSVLNLLRLFLSQPAKCISTYWDMWHGCESVPSQPDKLY